MDFGGIIKRAWKITWRYKILWLFGLFAGSSMSGGNGGGGSSNYSSDFSEFQNLDINNAASEFASGIEQYLGLIIFLIVFLVLIGIAFWIVSVAARGGLVYLVNEAAEERPVKAGPGWSVGFQYWGRLFLVRFLLYLPLVLIVVIVLAVTIIPLALAGSFDSDAFGVGMLGLCGGLAVLFLVLVVLGFVVELIDAFAQRHVVLGDTTAIEGIKAGWTNLKTRFKDSLLMWLIQLGFGLAFSIALVVLVVILAIPAVLVGIATGVFGGLLLGFLALLALMVPVAAFSTFSSALWTIFWRRMTGRELVQVAAPIYEPYAAIPVPPPNAPAPPAPPAAPAPPAPPQV